MTVQEKKEQIKNKIARVFGPPADETVNAIADILNSDYPDAIAHLYYNENGCSFSVWETDKGGFNGDVVIAAFSENGDEIIMVER